ncbi:hypothetical protein TcasGA2_TC013583 [Tribolium castaneum]|uniref:Uncharacterized protein n=1 Tax=Tribolium castaneum TaxID=7070 RepID=D6W753_TRICA|nr:hypothetical protein TcasGA2_TC013583 [Tribolium castaneum]
MVADGPISSDPEQDRGKDVAMLMLRGGPRKPREHVCPGAVCGNRPLQRRQRRTELATLTARRQLI